MGSSPTSATNPDPIGFGVRPGGQAVKTPPFHGGNTSSILVRVTKIPNADAFGIFLLYNNFAGMAELADAPVLGTGGQPCRFDPCYLHQKTKAKTPSFFLVYSELLPVAMLTPSAMRFIYYIPERDS